MSVMGGVLVGLAVYAAIGMIFSIAFSLRGAGAIDPVARHAPWSFRLIVLPAAAALWPVLVVKWFRAGRGVPHTPGGGA